MRPVHFRSTAAALVLLCTSGLLSSAAQAQSRMSDRDVEHLIVNLHEDVQAFRDPFTSALKKSAIRRTSQEKDAREMAKRLDAQTATLLQTFRKTKRGDVGYAEVKTTAAQIDSVVRGLGSPSQATARWDKVEADLQAMDPAFGPA